MRPRRGSAFWRWAAAILLAAAAVPLFWGQTPAPPSGEASAQPGLTWDVPDEIVVELREDATPDRLNSLMQTYGTSFIPAGPPGSPGRILTGVVPPALRAGLLARLRSDPAVEAAEPQRLFRLPPMEPPWKPPASLVTPGGPERGSWKPNDPRYNEQWNFQRIKMEQAWPLTKGKGAVVAVIDTGVAFEQDHKCYLARDFKGTRFTDPYDFVHRDKHPTDDNGHGTHVAGTIAETTHNGEGVAGIAFEAKIMPLKVLSAEGSGRLSDVASAIRYAADRGANIINMSLGAPFGDRILRNACRYAFEKGVSIVCAAGNRGREGVSYPAAYPECIAVSALGPTGELAPYSSWGPQIAISAPGGDKTHGEQAGILQNTYLDGQDDYFFFQGTSMATPHVAGVAALVVSRGIKDPKEVRAILQKSAQPRGPREKYGAGELDAAAATRAAGAAAADYYGRLWLVGALWLGCLTIAGVRRRYGTPGPWAGTLALTIGLFFPDLVTAFAGFGSAWNLLGHSVLIPAFLLIAEAESPAERRFYGLLAAGLALHLGWDLWHGTAPLLGPVNWAALPWLWTNVVVGFGTFVAGLRRG